MVSAFLADGFAETTAGAMAGIGMVVITGLLTAAILGMVKAWLRLRDAVSTMVTAEAVLLTRLDANIQDDAHTQNRMYDLEKAVGDLKVAVARLDSRPV